MSAENLAAASRSAWGGDIEPLLERLNGQGESLAARAESWSAINSGSFELAGLAAMRAPLLDAVSELPAAPEVVALSPSQRVRADGEITDVQHGASIRVRVRPDAPIQIALTGHYDTVFPASHPFQSPWREGDVLRGPGVADMKGAGLTPRSSSNGSSPGRVRTGSAGLVRSSP